MTRAPQPAGHVLTQGHGNGRPGATRRRHPYSDAPSGRNNTRRQRERRMVALAFLAPATLMLLVLVCYPIANTIWLSVHSSDGRGFVGLDNYVRMFTAPETRRAIMNNVVWVVAAPAIVTTLGLMFAVLTERVRRSTALKVILFMPMAISFLAAGVTFRLVYDENPDRGALNAAVVAVHDMFAPPSKYYDATPREEARLVPIGGGFETANTVGSDDPIPLPLVGLPQARIPEDATPALSPSVTPTCAAWSGSTSPAAAAAPPASSTRPNSACPA